MVGHIAEIFNYISSSPSIDEDIIQKSSRLIQLLVIDTYTLFDTKWSGDWRIIGHHENYTPKDVENIYFAYGLGNLCKKVDVYGNETPIPESEKDNYIRLAPLCDEYIKDIVLESINGKSEMLHKEYCV